MRGGDPSHVPGVRHGAGAVALGFLGELLHHATAAVLFGGAASPRGSRSSRGSFPTHAPAVPTPLLIV